MNKLLLALILFVSSFQVQNSLQAAQVIISTSDQIYDHSWTAHKDELYLNLKLPEGLVFAERYEYMATKDSLGCAVTCKLDGKHDFFVPSDKTHDGLYLKEVVIEAEVKYLSTNKNQVPFTIRTIGKYKTNIGINRTITTTSQGTLQTPAIDLKKYPEFFFTNKERTGGVIVFKNTAPK